VTPAIDTPAETSRRPRLAASYYLNSAPLIWSFARGRGRERVRLLTDAAPARCAAMLARGEAEAALVPVIECQRIEGAGVVAGVCVGAREEVRSVVLVTRGVELKEVRSVALDATSRTSAALVRIVFREFLGSEPEFAVSEPDVGAMLARHDAALIIGDPAMTFAREGLRVFDLARVWRERTGLGFVFAVWMAREGTEAAAGSVDFKGARDEGLARAEEIADHYADALGRPRAELLTYLRENICYDLNAEMRAGLDLYFRLAHKHGLIPDVRPLRWLGT
jgi:chorismate dehydratase